MISKFSDAMGHIEADLAKWFCAFSTPPVHSTMKTPITDRSRWRDLGDGCCSTHSRRSRRTRRVGEQTTTADAVFGGGRRGHSASLTTLQRRGSCSGRRGKRQATFRAKLGVGQGCGVAFPTDDLFLGSLGCGDDRRPN